jgi:predicted DNA-binding transcriptional regulator AlpA
MFVPWKRGFDIIRVEGHFPDQVSHINKAAIMHFDLEPQDIEAIAERVIEKLIPRILEIQSPDPLLDIIGVAKLLGKSKGQIYQWVNLASHGLSDFPFEKAGRSLRFSEKAIRGWTKKKSLRR